MYQNYIFHQEKHKFHLILWFLTVSPKSTLILLGHHVMWVSEHLYNCIALKFWSGGPGLPRTIFEIADCCR